MAAITNSPFTGAPLIYRDSQYASRGFQIDSTNFVGTALIPRPKFLFFVKFNRDTGEATLDQSNGELNRFSNIKTGIVFQIKSIDKPKFNIQTDTLIQYNKKRVIQTRIDYNPMTIQFHDDIGDKVLKFWEDYYRYYYGDISQFDSSSWRDDIVKTDFDEGVGSGWGYQGSFRGGTAESMHFLENIELIQFYGGRKTTMTFVHPKISSFDHDSSDYADGTTGQGITIQFDYEGVLYKTNEALSIDDKEQFGFNEATFRDLGIIEREPISGGAGRAFNINSGLNPQGFPPPTRSQGNFGAAAITNRIVSDSNARVSAGIRTLSGTGISFGTGSLGRFSGNVSSLVTAASLAGQVPSPDLLEKATGVQLTINNFGISAQPTFDQILGNPRTITNTGLDAAKVTEAAALLNSENFTGDQVIAPGQSIISDARVVNSFSRAFGTGAALARNQGIIGAVANFTNSITSNSGDSNALVNKLPTGEFQLTDRGSGIMNSLRSQNSALGARRPINPFINPDTVNTNRRNLNAEINNSTPLDI